MRKLFAILLILPILAFTQTEKQIDSISKLIENEVSDSIKSILLIKKSTIYEKSSSIDSAIATVNKAIELADKNIINYNKARAHIILGNIHLNRYKYDLAFKNYALADSICKGTSYLKKSNIRAKALNFLGYAVRLTHDYEKASAFYQKAKSMYKELGDESGLQEVNIGLAQSYVAEKKYDDALELLNEAVTYHKKNNTGNPYTYAVIVRGYLLVKMKRFEEAEKDYLNYYNIAREGNNKTKQLRSLSYLGYFYAEKGDLENALKYYKKGIQMSKKEGNLFMLEETQKGLIKILKRTNNLKELANAYESYIDTKSKQDSINKSNEIYELETKYQTQQKEQEIALLAAKNQLSEQRRKNQEYLYIAILGVLLTVAGFLFFAYQNKLKISKKMKELNRLKSRFFANISHEFRTPLTLIMSPVQQLQSSVPNKEQQTQLHLINTNANRMLELVDQLLELSKIESGTLKVILKKGNLYSFLNALMEPYQFRAKEENIPFEVDIKPLGKDYFFDRDILTKIVVNLLTNAFKYRDKDTPVTFSAKVTSEQLQLKISNATNQLKKGDLQRIFGRFYQNNDKSMGFGIGLALIKDLVELYEGSISVRLNNGKATFLVELPLHKNLKQAVIIEEESVDYTFRTIQQDTSFESDETPVLLVVDDNMDIRVVLRNLFKKEFKVLEAQNGKEAYELAQNEIPDMIISDVMMPEIDGFKLTNKLKNNELTSLIPVVLLTAKTTDETHLAAIKNTADAYLTKPFNHDIVIATVKQLLQERKKWQERYSRELILKPLDIIISTADEKFIKRLENVLENELANPDFTTDKFAQQMHLSRMQLHRKLKSLLGVSATEFVRNERLKAAAELLKNQKLSVAEVAYSSGFNEVTYFSKCFKNIYNQSPSTFRKDL